MNVTRDGKMAFATYIVHLTGKRKVVTQWTSPCDASPMFCVRPMRNG
jgi:hypothetical protein